MSRRALADLIDTALAAHPDVQRIDHGIGALREQERLRVAQYFPDIFIAAQLRYAIATNRDDQTSAFAKDDFNFFDAGIAAGLRHRWPTGVQHHEVAQARAELRSLETKREALVEEIAHRVTQAHAGFAAKERQITLRKQAFRAARAWSVSALNGLELGTGSVKDTVEALRAFIEVRFGLLQTLFEQNKAAAELSQAVGRELQAGLTDENED